MFNSVTYIDDSSESYSQRAVTGVSRAPPATQMSHGNPRDKNKRGRGQNLRTGEGVDAPVQLHAVTLHHLHVYELPRGLVWYSVSYCNNFNITLHCCVITVITVFPDPLHLTTSKVRECNKDRKKTSKQLSTMLSQRGDSVSARTVR